MINETTSRILMRSRTEICDWLRADCLYLRQIGGHFDCSTKHPFEPYVCPVNRNFFFSILLTSLKAIHHIFKRRCLQSGIIRHFRQHIRCYNGFHSVSFCQSPNLSNPNRLQRPLGIKTFIHDGYFFSMSVKFFLMSVMW